VRMITMQMICKCAAVSALLGALLLPGVPRMCAQDTQAYMPEQSEAKAKEVLAQAIQALGGSAYLNVQDSTCEGRLSAFGHSGDLTGFGIFTDFWKMPDKDRTEHSKKGNIVEVFSGKEGWVLDQGGVANAPASAVARFQSQLQGDLDHILRYRIKEDGMVLRYGGPDVVDLKEVDWVELTDSENHTYRIAIAKLTHLPVRKVTVSQDPTTQIRIEEIEYYSNYQTVQGLQIPFQMTRTRNDLKVFQVFFNTCKYNTGLQDSFFTKASLDERASQVLKKKKF